MEFKLCWSSFFRTVAPSYTAESLPRRLKGTGQRDRIQIFDRMNSYKFTYEFLLVVNLKDGLP
jgi:hypothetical protein